jgi:putative membrane protein
MSNVKAVDFFAVPEKERIRAAVAAAEAKTAGEIATLVVTESDRYREAELLGAVLCAGLLALIFAVAGHHVTIWSYIPLVVLLFFPSLWLIRRMPALKLPFIGRSRLHEAVRTRAVRAFYEQGLYRTRNGTGILIFISLLEHKVWILGDRGINEKIAPESWQTLAGILAKGLREGRACDALCEVINRCGIELASHFPRQADDVNELSDEVLG